METEIKLYKKQQFFSKDFPFAITCGNHKKEYFNLSRRFKREFWKISYITRGAGDLVIGDMLYPVAPQSLYIIHPDAQTTMDMHNDEVEICNIIFDRSLIENMLSDVYDAYHLMRIFSNDYHQENEFPLFIVRAGKNERALIDRMREEFYSDYPNRRHMLQLELCELLLLILRQVNDSAYHNPEWVVKFIDDNIGKNFRNSISIRELASQLRVTPEHLSRLYHSKTGKRIVSEIKRLRLEYAAEMLKSTRSSVYEVCYTSGFNDTSYFCRSFLEKFGVTPECYRAKIGQN
ncbi:MAG: helix-turn-helix domain-containing protein [Lentisphaerae bacterium]|nr:helix-turn-helix domain-containing protein [Lentisphaerota bacterium]